MFFDLNHQVFKNTRPRTWGLGALLPLLVVSVLRGESLPAAGDSLNWMEKADARIKKFVESHGSNAADRVFDWARWMGDWRVYLGVTAAFYAGREDEMGELALKAGAINGAATESLRYVVGRVRPRDAESPGSYRIGGHAFPSGHTSAAFALATALDETYGVGYVTYPAAALTGMSRLYHGGHWFSDTLMGAGIGIASAKAVALHDERGVDFEDSSEVYAEAFGAFTVADLIATRLEKGPARTALRAAAIGFAASRIEDEQDIYAAFAGVATSVLLTRGLKKFKTLKITPTSISLAWEW